MMKWGGGRGETDYLQNTDNTRKNLTLFWKMLQKRGKKELDAHEKREKKKKKTQARSSASVAVYLLPLLLSLWT